MHYRVEILKNGCVAVSKDREADNPQQAVNWLISKSRIKPYYSVVTINENGDMWLYQIYPKGSTIKIEKTAYERGVLQGTILHSVLSGNISIPRALRWN